MEDFFSNPAAPAVIVVLAMGAVMIGLVILMECSGAKDAAKLAAAEANAQAVRGKISRFGTVSADEYSVKYTFTLEGDPTVYRTSSDYLSSTSHGALTKPGDVVTFNVLPGYGYVRDFYNAATATGASR